MAITFDIGNGATVRVLNDTQNMQTTRGNVPANEVVQGDKIMYVKGYPPAEVMSPPVVE